MGKQSKSEIITFKADGSMLGALRKVANRSEFIRTAVLAALENICPLCGGLGVLTPDQRNHWDRLAVDHTVEECEECHATHVVCRRPPGP